MVDLILFIAGDENEESIILQKQNNILMATEISYKNFARRKYDTDVHTHLPSHMDTVPEDEMAYETAMRSGIKFN